MLSEVAKNSLVLAALYKYALAGYRRASSYGVAGVYGHARAIAWIAGAYAAQNVLYSVALGRQIGERLPGPEQKSKMIFTAILAVTMLKEKLRKRDIAALVCLLGGSTHCRSSRRSPAPRPRAPPRRECWGGFAVLGALPTPRSAERLVREAAQRRPARTTPPRNAAGHRLDLLVDRAVQAGRRVRGAARAGLSGAVDQSQSAELRARVVWQS